MANEKILIVYDDVDLTKALQVTLESEHYTVVTATDRTEGEGERCGGTEKMHFPSKSSGLLYLQVLMTRVSRFI